MSIFGNRVVFVLDSTVRDTFGKYTIVSEQMSQLGAWKCKVTTLDDFTDGAKANVLKEIMKSALKKVRRKNLLQSKQVTQ